MEIRQMIQVYSHESQGFKAIFEYGEWKIGLINENSCVEVRDNMARHLLTDEIFALICGNATLYTDSEIIKMKIGNVYNVPAGVWHQVIVDEASKVLVVENRNTSKENTERKLFEYKEKTNAHK